MTELTIAHSPDSDDAYMMAPLALGWLDPGGFRFRFVREDIEKLNIAASDEVYDVTAISFGAYPGIRDKYDLLRAGSSIQEGTGPVLVARQPMGDWLETVEVAVPGLRTSAWLALRQWNPRLRPRVMPFDEILSSVAEGRAAAGLLIHESQLQYQVQGLELLVDLGAWWKDRCGLPLPMGGNAIRKGLPHAVKTSFASLMRQSVAMARQRHDESVEYAQSFGRGMDREMVSRYVQAWVNDFTLDPGPRGEEAVALLLGEKPVWVEIDG